MAEFLQFAFSGLTVGAVYALVALGFTLIYNASDVINFAQGEFVMLGGMATVFLAAAGVPLPLAALGAIVAHRRGRARAASPGDRAGARRQHRRADHHHHRRVDLPARRRRGRSSTSASTACRRCVGNEPIHFGGAAILPQSLVVLAGAAVIVTALCAVHAAHPVRQGDRGDRRQPAGGAARRHQHADRSSASRSASRPRSARSPACSSRRSR